MRRGEGKEKERRGKMGSKYQYYWSQGDLPL